MPKKDAKKHHGDGDRQISPKNSENTDVASSTKENVKLKNYKPHRQSNTADSSPKGFLHYCRKAWVVTKYALLILIIPPFLNFAALHQEAKHLKPEGELYDIGYGQKLFMGCRGKGEPTVILDAPTGMSSDVWALVQPELAKITKVCVYDRAGLGFSDRPFKNYSENAEQGSYNQNGPGRWKEYTVERMADDVRRLFTVSSDQQRPFILVGSELGAIVSRFYAQIYEADVSDLVLIDPLVEDIFTQDGSVWTHFWFDHLIPSFQAMQLAAASGITRLLLVLGVMETPISGKNIPNDIILRQKYTMCNPRHLSSVVDEHHFINDTFSQMHVLFSMKAFPSNVSVTVITGNYYDEQLPSALNKAWAKSQQHLISRLHPSSKHIVVNGADHRMLYRKPDAVIEPIKRIIKYRRSKNDKAAVQSQ